MGAERIAPAYREPVLGRYYRDVSGRRVPVGYRIETTDEEVETGWKPKRRWTRWGANRALRRMQIIRRLDFPFYEIEVHKRGRFDYRLVILQNVLVPLP